MCSPICILPSNPAITSEFMQWSCPPVEFELPKLKFKSFPSVNNLQFSPPFFCEKHYTQPVSTKLSPLPTVRPLHLLHSFFHNPILPQSSFFSVPNNFQLPFGRFKLPPFPTDSPLFPAFPKLSPPIFSFFWCIQNISIFLMPLNRYLLPSQSRVPLHQKTCLSFFSPLFFFSPIRFFQFATCWKSQLLIVVPLPGQLSLICLFPRRPVLGNFEFLIYFIS